MKRRLGAVVVLMVAAAAAVAGPTSAGAAFPGRNGLIAFQADTGTGNQIYTVGRDGHHLRQITHVQPSSDTDPGTGGATNPDWSPRGRWIAFSYNECTLALIHPDGSGLRRIPSQTPGGCETDPAFTPDGRHLVFERYDPTADDDAVWIMRLDGSDRRRLGAGPDDGGATPEVSPDGRTVTFLSETPDHLTAVFAVDIAGGPVRQVTPTLWGIAFKHDWAPNGSRLVVTDNADNTDRPANIATIRPDGTGLRYLTDLRRPDRRALVGGYSPDGKWIVFRLEHGDQSALMVMRKDGSHRHTVLPFSSFRPRFIDWGPAAQHHHD